MLKDDIRNALLDYGFESFKEIGYRKTKISMLTKRAGITTSTFYSYFESKNEFLMQIFDVWIERVIVEYFGTPDDCEEKPIEKQIRDFLTFSWIYIPQKDNCFIMNFLEAFLDLSSKELEKQEEYSLQDQKEFFNYYGMLMENVLKGKEYRAIGHMIHHSSIGFLIDYQLNKDRATKDAEEAIDGFLELLKNMKRI